MEQSTVEIGPSGEIRFGVYELPLEREGELLTINAHKTDYGIHYKRHCKGDDFEKNILTEADSLIINPVEPLYKPVKVSEHLLIKFEKPLEVEPNSEWKVYLKFPIQLGVFIMAKRHYDIVDIFTLNDQKYTLYGDPSTGTMCRYWKSPIYFDRPEMESRREGLLELTIKNTISEWVVINKAVFNAWGMKIYYSSNIVSMKAIMRVTSKILAETDFLEQEMGGDVHRALEVFHPKKISLVSNKFLMENGL